MITIEQLKLLKESEDHVEFKKGEGGNIAYNGGSKTEPSERRRCILGYITALCNEGGGRLVIGMHDKLPHKVVGTKQCEGEVGELEARIYRDTSIRTTIYELYDGDKRVLVIEVPGRPAGRVFKFEDVTLMRVGEELKPMSDEVYLKILQEQEPDFSQQFCENLVLSDLDLRALEVMKEKYALKQNNPRFKTLSDRQILIDLDLLKAGKLTNAALILLGKEEVIKKSLPQCAVMLEYRNTESQIHFDNRFSFRKAFFLLIDELWQMIDLRNGSVPIQEGAYIFNIPFFNEEVIRESVNNAITHRDYRRSGEIVIKQYPKRLDIVNPGSFPIGVTINNLLTVPSTPRNRLLADVLQKTGVVERSGQGIDKIFYNTLSEGKTLPDYSRSDYFNVYLSLSSIIEDQVFNVVRSYLEKYGKIKMGDLVCLFEGRLTRKQIRKIVEKLLERKWLQAEGKAKGAYYILSPTYEENVKILQKAMNIGLNEMMKDTSSFKKK